MATETITLRLVAQDLMSGNVSKAISGLDKLAKQGGLVGSVLQGVGQSFGQMLNPVALVANGIGAVTDMMADSVKAASDQAEALSKVTVVFGEQSDEIKSWANTAADSMGLSKTAALDAAGSLGNLFDGMGLAADASLDMSRSIVQLAADLGSFNNVATDDALVALKAGLVGETEPMRRFGVALSAARVEAHGMARGMERVNGKLTEAAKMQARYELILEGTKNAQGDFARTADGLANSQKSLDAALADISAGMGAFLMGPARDFTNWLRDLVTSGSGDGSFNDAVAAAVKMRAGIADIGTEVESGKGAWENYLDGLQAFNDVLNPAADEARDFRISIDDLRIAAGLSEQAIVDAFFAFKDGAQMGSEGAKKAVTDMVTSIILAGETSTTVSPLLSEAWRGAMSDVEEATTEGVSALIGLEGAVMSMPEVFKIAVVDMKSAIKTGKTGIIEQMRDLAWQSKHPFREKNYAKWLKRKQRQATEAMMKVNKEKFPGLYAQHAQLVEDIQLEWLMLPRNLARIQGQVSSILGSIYSSVTNAVAGAFSPGSGGSAGVEPRASGGSVQAGRTYVVGERGPELLTMGGNGYVTPNHALGGPSVNVYVTHIGSMSEAEGDRLAAVIEKPLRRRMARSGA